MNYKKLLKDEFDIVVEGMTEEELKDLYEQMVAAKEIHDNRVNLEVDDLLFDASKSNRF
jgi:hypothetical protein